MPISGQRAILNFTPAPPRGERSHQGWNLSHRGNVHPFVHPPPGVNNLYCLEEWKGKERISAPGDNFSPRGQNSPLGDNFTPEAEVKNGPLSTLVKLRLAVLFWNLNQIMHSSKNTILW
jgi:hypothetical protein